MFTAKCSFYDIRLEWQIPFHLSLAHNTDNNSNNSNDNNAHTNKVSLLHGGKKDSISCDLLSFIRVCQDKMPSVPHIVLGCGCLFVLYYFLWSMDVDGAHTTSIMMKNTTCSNYMPFKYLPIFCFFFLFFRFHFYSVGGILFHVCLSVYLSV